jgi:hypothetical protein
MGEAEQVEHGIQSAYYSNGPTGYEPAMECICGEAFKEFNWEETGAMFDAHLKETTVGQGAAKL